MQRLYVTIVLIGFTVGSILAAGGGNADDHAKLQGTWALSALVEKGRAETPERVRTLSLIIKGDKYSYRIAGTDAKFVATFKIDASAKPKSIDIIFEDGPLKGKTMKSIYALDGDELRICGGRDIRPTEFSSTKGGGEIVFTFRRTK